MLIMAILFQFWPTGSGAGRGFLSAIDAAWAVSEWFTEVQDDVYDIDSMLNVIGKREYIYRKLAQTTPENVTSKNFSLSPTTRYKNVNMSVTNGSDELREIRKQVRHLIIDKNEVNRKKYATSYETKRARRATVGINSEDVYKASKLNAQFDSLFDELNANYSYNSSKTNLSTVPSATDVRNSNYNVNNNCDSNSPIQVIEYKPKNSGQNYEPRNIINAAHANSRSKVDYKPKNHYLSVNDDDDLMSRSDQGNGGNLSSSSNHSFHSEKHLSQSVFDLNNHNKENSYFNKLLNEDSTPYNHKSKLNMDKFNFLASNTNNLNEYKWRNDPTVLLPQSKQKKKSLFIKDMANHLEQKFEEVKKPFEPNLQKVGKIADEDWNVKMWNSTDVFG